MASVLGHGGLHRLDFGDLTINLFPGNELESGPTQIWLRRWDVDGIHATPLLGPGTPGVVVAVDGRPVVVGSWQGLDFTVELVLSEEAPAWFWHVQLTNGSGDDVMVDVVYSQDVALSPYPMLRTNELYVSQYLDRAVLEHPVGGVAVALRNNLGVNGLHPWLLVGSLRRGVGFATDALAVCGRDARFREPLAVLTHPNLPDQTLAHEHAMATVADEPMMLVAGQQATAGFFGVVSSDHPDATGDADIAVMDHVRGLPEANPGTPAVPGPPCGLAPAVGAGSCYSHGRTFAADDLTDEDLASLFGPVRGHQERASGDLLAFTTARDTHVVLRGKERVVLRPHGHIIRTGSALVPDPGAMASTTWMAGVFASQVTSGDASARPLVSRVRSYLGLEQAAGMRVFVAADDGWVLLGVPSAYEVCPASARWIYRSDDMVIEVVSAASSQRHELTTDVRVLVGPDQRFRLVMHLDEGEPDELQVGWQDPAVVATTGGDELLFDDGSSRGMSVLVTDTRAVRAVGVRLRGVAGSALSDVPGGCRVQGEPTAELASTVQMNAPIGSRHEPRIRALSDVLPWFVHDALVHYLSPRGLEQANGGLWGTRDVCQGPVELLLGLGRPAAVGQLLALVYAAQESDGSWSQAFAFLPGDDRRMGPVHGDVIFWPLLALGEYVCHTGDTGLLDSLGERIRQALANIRDTLVPGTHLAPYGHGDWNDSLQPVDPQLSATMVSTWTVTLQYRTLRVLSEAVGLCGQESWAQELSVEADCVLADFRAMLAPDGVLAGYVVFGAADTEGMPARPVRYLAHPSDTTTGLRLSILPMIHAISYDMLDPTAAVRHVELINKHLLGPDGARLFDAPITYRGGPERLFRRAESAAYFGREIGLMYTHAHLRYAEAMARLGRADELLLALAQAHPLDSATAVPQAQPRQSFSYYASSDAVFLDRYQADRDYPKLMAGEVAVEGGWRVYSSGPGIWVGLIVEKLLGVRTRADAIEIDPVLPVELDGLRATVPIADRTVTVQYRISRGGAGVSRVLLNGIELPTEPLSNPYRTPGVRVALADFLSDDDVLLIEVG
ncbi:MAG: hypothetical protein WCP28_15620 [Actinomycetes bacterium]